MSTRRRDSSTESIHAFLDRFQFTRHIRRDVCELVFTLAADLAANGLPEKQPHHGFTIVVGHGRELMSLKPGRKSNNPLTNEKRYRYFTPSDFNMFERGHLHISSDHIRRNAFHGDGAVVVDGRTGNVLGAGMIVSDLTNGGERGGGRHKSSKAVAHQAGGCFVVKCSEDSRGALSVFMNDVETMYLGVRRSSRTSSGRASASKRKAHKPVVTVKHNGRRFVCKCRPV